MVSPISGPVATYTDSSVFQSLPPAIQDTLIQAFSTAELNAQFPTSVSLPTPDLMTGSSADYFTSIANAARGLSQQLSASELIDQTKRGLSNRAAALLVFSLDDLYAQRATQQANDAAQAQQLTQDFQQLLDDMETDATNFSLTIDNFNAGNATETAQLNAIYNAHQTYINQLNTIGSFSGNTFTIGAGNQAQYNAYTTTYQAAVASFNAYLAGREGAISSFNGDVSTYNQSATQNNADVQNTITTYGLSGALASGGVTSGQLIQPSATARTDLYGGILVSAPPLVSGATMVVTVPDLPAGVLATRTQGVPLIPSISYTAPNVSFLRSAFQDSLDAQNLSDFNSAIQFKLLYFGALSINSIFEKTSNVKDPILNFHPIARKLLPDTVTNTEQPSNTATTEGGGMLAARSLSLHSSHVLGILGAQAFSQVLDASGLDLTADQRQEAIGAFAVFSAILLTSNGVQALFPSLAPILGNMGVLPLDSPVFGILFAISFANRAVELEKSGLSKEALQAFLEKAGLQGLSASLQGQLADLLNVALLLASLKLLATVSSSTGLLEEFATGALPADRADAVIQQARAELRQQNEELRRSLREDFLRQGYAQDQADFLANTAVNVSQAENSPSVSAVSEELIQKQALLDSITASVIIGQQRAEEGARSLQKAKQIAQDAVQQSLQAIEIRTDAISFRNLLEENLRANGVKKAIAIAAAQEALLLPAASSVGGAGLPPALLVGLPPQLRQLIQVEFQKSVFGGAASLEEAVSFEAKYPSALYQALKRILRHDRVQKEEIFGHAVEDLFKESLKTSTDFNKFIEKLLDPANSLIYSMQTGLMYGGNEPKSFKKSIDIIV